MGLRYNTPSTSWVRDTAFLDITYQRLDGHGPPGTQNSYQYMLTRLARRVSVPRAWLWWSAKANAWLELV